MFFFSASVGREKGRKRDKNKVRLQFSAILLNTVLNALQIYYARVHVLTFFSILFTLIVCSVSSFLLTFTREELRE
jgi:hypothetical protein